MDSETASRRRPVLISLHGLGRLLLMVGLLAGSALLGQETAGLEQEREWGSDWFWVASPMFGYNHNALKRTDREGNVVEYTKNAPEYGAYLMAAHPHLVINNFLFLTEAADDIDVIGNLFYLNLYGDPDAVITWNLGAGHLYHDIKDINLGPHRSSGTIRVRVPQVKAGPMIRIKPWHLSLNPYFGYGWERTGMQFSNTRIKNNSWMYGITADWRWRMLNLNAKYIYQDSRAGQENFNSLHLRLVTAVTRNWGLSLRFDHMEHATTDDTSFLLGPVFVF